MGTVQMAPKPHKRGPNTQQSEGWDEQTHIGLDGRAALWRSLLIRGNDTTHYVTPFGELALPARIAAAGR